MNMVEKVMKAANDGIVGCFECGGGEAGVSVCVAPEGKDGRPVALALFVTDPEKAAAIKAAWDAIDGDT